MKTCRTCGVTTDDFYPKHARCRPCYLKTIKKKSPVEHRERNLKQNYGITTQDYDDMLEKQGGTCACCDATPETQRHNRLHVDHSHTTGDVRGLLCHNCNTALGLLGEDPARFASLTSYILNNDRNNCNPPAATLAGSTTT